MKLSIRHRTTYSYDAPCEYAAQVLRMTPRMYDGLQVVSWRVAPLGPGKLTRFEDGFGNLSHVHTVAGLHDHLGVEISGTVETDDRQGRVRASEPLPVGVYLRSTPLTAASEGITGLAREAARATSTSAVLRRLMELVAEHVAYAPGTTTARTTAAEAHAGGHGVCQDHAHVFISAARVLGIPARYVGGYLCLEGDGFLSEANLQDAGQAIPSMADAGHAWAEAWDGDHGWTGFDPANGTLPGPWHVRTSVGLDYESASPVRGVRRGAGGEVLQVGVQVSRLGEQ